MTAEASQDRAAEAQTFAAALFGNVPTGSLLVVSFAPRWTSRWVTTPSDVVNYTLGTVDAYVRLTPMRARPRGGRGGDELTCAVSGIALDLDVNGSPDGKGGVVRDAFPDLDAAQEAAHALLEPTLTVCSGYGLQPYYLFTEPIVLSGAGDLTAAREMMAGYQAAAHAASGVRKFDSVMDLSRVMRVPGSLNGKGEQPVPVTLFDDGGPRYAVEQIIPFARRNGNGSPKRAPDDAPGRTPEDLLKRFPKLGKIARRELDDAPGDGSPSAWDFHLCCEAIRRVKPKVTPGELEALIRHARGLHGDAKGERADYVKRTAERALEREAGAVAPEDSAPEELIAWISGQWRLDSDNPIVAWQAIGYGAAATIKLSRRDGSVMRFGRLAELYDAALHVRQVSIAGRCRCPNFDKAAAIKIAQALGEACGVVDDPDSEPSDFEERLTEFVAGLGHVTEGATNDWRTLVEVVDYTPMEPDGFGKFRPKRGPLSAAERACGVQTADVQTADSRLWIPAGPLADHMIAHGFKVQGGVLRTRMEEAGWEHVRVEMREPKDERPEGVTREGARHLIRVFYGNPSNPSNPNAPALHMHREREEGDLAATSRARGLDGLDGQR